ncbi:snapalysin family zinc-dependent metalloprotease [Streptomyces sp. PTM05]|uniref:Extracellular small neutral protease n=1 Tax=Streptantibioticus parmotrematis TaxID=2873249 RepID=A0ABS7QYB8_9ACTN|nr:snapalysin family zinc-dependent metalloprotease [Streptantibioticus parmotrematis]MBY8887340.1 snapalysin family zinc-dependent metalloprotease [Streptantibioticus parmotrematis]
MIKRIVTLTVLVPALLSTAVSAAEAHPAPRATADVVTLTYDASDAGQWAGPIEQAVQNWNNAVHNVRLEPTSTPGEADYVYEATSGWPQTTLGPIFPGGSGEVQLGQQAVDEGYDATRITAHETGHILGLPDDYSGPCSEIMSGHGPGTSCTNAKPDAAEAAQVDKNYADGATAMLRNHHHQIVIDVWTGRVLTGSH